MSMTTNNLDVVDPTRKKGNEYFTAKGRALDFNVTEFWQWSVSDLLSNATRGILAEFIVAKSLGLAEDVRTEWDAFDIIYKNIKIEVKSSAYIQSWQQEKFSKIIFGIQPTYGLDGRTNEMSNVKRRQADVYVFCVLAHKDQKTINPLNLDQWEFYILTSRILDEKIPNQKTITLSSLLNLNPIKAEFGQIRTTIERLLQF